MNKKDEMKWKVDEAIESYKRYKEAVEEKNIKEEMIKEMKKLLADSDFSDEEVKKVRDMQKEFEKIGFAGKEKDDDLYARFNEVTKKYFEEKKFYTL